MTVGLNPNSAKTTQTTQISTRSAEDLKENDTSMIWFAKQEGITSSFEDTDTKPIEVEGKLEFTFSFEDTESIEVFAINLQEISTKNVALDLKHVDSDKLKKIIPLLKNNKKIEKLSLSFNNSKIGDSGAKALVGANLTNLEELNLDDNGIGCEGAKAIAKMIKNNKNLKMLSLNKNKIGSLGAHDLGLELRFNENLKTLNLSEIADHMEYVPPGFAYMINLEELNLDYNGIGCEGVKALALALTNFKGPSNLKMLSLKGNHIGKEGAEALANAKLTNLETLDLSGTSIGNEGLKAIAKMIKNNKNLKKLNLSATRIGAKGLKYLVEEANLTTLENLDISSNWIGDEGSEALAIIIKNNENLTTLNLSNIHIGGKGLQAILKASKANTKLEQLGVGPSLQKFGIAIDLANGKLTNLTTLNLTNLKTPNLSLDEGAKAEDLANGKLTNLEQL